MESSPISQEQIPLGRKTLFDPARVVVFLGLTDTIDSRGSWG